jgi:hypothetical protein
LCQAPCRLLCLLHMQTVPVCARLPAGCCVCHSGTHCSRSCCAGADWCSCCAPADWCLCAALVCLHLCPSSHMLPLTPAACSCPPPQASPCVPGWTARRRCSAQ